MTLFSAHLDEAGTNDRSPYTVLAGLVAPGQRWSKFERAWGQLLTSRNVNAYHWKEFNHGDDEYFGWSDLKRKRFVDRQEKIINNNTLFRVSIGIEKDIHKDIKGRMKGIKGFTPESDHSLCLRYLMFATSEQLLRIDKKHRLSILVEDGPWSAGANTTYQRVARMTGRWKPAKHAHRLAGFASAPKGEYYSLEAADYVAGSEHKRMISGNRQPQKQTERLSLLLDGELLESWYEGMVKEKEARRAFGG